MTDRRPTIPIHAAAEPTVHGNVLPLLHEVRHALEKLLDSGEETTIDLRAIPMGPGEEAEIERVLGTGEVTIEISAIGASTVQESAYGGVWLTTHRNEEGETVSRFIEVTFLPPIAKSQRDDVRDALEALTETLKTSVT